MENVSILIQDQLPEYIVSDPNYEKFVSFLTAYYDWMEQEYGVTKSSRNILSYSDIDSTSESFIKYFINQFLPNFPNEAVTDKRKILKIAKQIYQSKGTASSFELLFRLLYNSDVNTTLTESMVFRASDGKWIVPRSIKINSTNPNFLNIKNLRIFGETSKSTATIDRSEITGNKIEIYISDIEKLFESGEFIRIVDSFNRDVYFYEGNRYFQADSLTLVLSPNGKGSFSTDQLVYTGKDISGAYVSPDFQIPAGSASATVYSWNSNSKELSVYNITGKFLVGDVIRCTTTDSSWTISDIIDNRENNHIPTLATPLRAKIIGSISSIKIDSNKKYRGSQYKVGDPVIIFGGLNPDVDYPIKAVAEVGEVTKGALEDITVIYSPNGFTVNDSFVSISGDIGTGKQAVAKVGLVDETKPCNTAIIAIDCILPFLQTTVNSNNYPFIKSTNNSLLANANTKLYDALSYTAFTTYPVYDIIVQRSDVGYSTIPQVSVESYYKTNYGPGSNTIIDSANSALMSLDGYFYGNLRRLGILAPIEIVNSGENYSVGDRIVFNGGSGFGAFANVTSIHSANGGIKTVSYVKDPDFSIETYPLGGMGYTNSTLPMLTVSSVSGANASLIVPSILAEGIKVTAVTDRIGSISSFLISNYGEDYISNPEISLRIKDIAVNNVDSSDVIVSGEGIYQGSSFSMSTFSGYIDSIIRLNDTVDSYRLRIFNYKGTLNPNNQILFANSSVSSVSVDTSYNTVNIENGQPEYINGVLTYGDGNAKAASRFLNGLIIGDGSYLNEDGQPSSYSVIQSDKYNKYTYIVEIEQSIRKYKEVLLNLLHPIGTQLIGKHVISTQEILPISYVAGVSKNKEIRYWFKSNNVSISVTQNNYPSNVIVINNDTSNSISEILSANDKISFSSNGIYVSSTIKSISDINETITIEDKIRTYYSNTIYGYINTSSNTLVITSYSDRYDLLIPQYFTYTNPITLEEYTANDITEVVYVGDSIVTKTGNSYPVISVSSNNTTGYYDMVLNVSSGMIETSGNTNTSVLFGFSKNINSIQALVCKLQ